MTWLERCAVAGALGYLALLSWAMQRLEYDLWGAMITAPILAVFSAPVINRMYNGRLRQLRPIAWVGLGLKFAGAVAGYFIRSGAYGGAADANRYHEAGARLAQAVRSGDSTILTVIPFERGTSFIEDLTGLVYTIFGSSKLGGYFVFAWLSYWGLVLTWKAAIIAIPLLARKRYAILLFATPSLTYWGSSIGKEAVIGCFLGLIALGAATAFAASHRRRSGIALVVIGTVGTAMIRPHFAAVWVGAVGIAFAVRLISNVAQRNSGTRQGSQVGAFLMLGLAAAGFLAVSTLTLNYLNPNQAVADDAAEAAITDRITAIFDKTENSTTTGSSALELVSTSSPVNYPYAAFRTLTRPLIIEVGSLTELLPAGEMTVLLALAALWWRRFANLPKLLFGNPYLVFALVCVVTFGVAFASIGNLGILVRQRSLVFPLMLVFWCLPERVAAQAPTAHPLRTQPATVS